MKNLLFRLVSVTLIIFILIQCFTQFAYADSNPEPMVKNITLFVGNETYKVKFNNLNSNAIVTYETSDKSIVSISKDGMIKGISKGKAVIKVTIKQGRYTYTSNIYVTISDPYVFIDNIPDSFEVSDTYILKAKAIGIKNPIFVWSSSDEAVASINKKTGEVAANAS